MQLGKNEVRILLQAIDEWQQEGLLSPGQASRLADSITARQSARQQIAQYFFFIALCCTLMAFGVIFLNEKLLEKIKAYFSLSDLVIALIAAVLSALWLWYVARKRSSISPAAFEVYMVLGGLFVLTSLVYFCKEFGLDKTYTAYLSISMPALAMLALTFRSGALWIGAILAAIGWWGAWTTWLSTDNLFLGMNYPVRYTLLGLLVLAVSGIQSRVSAISFSQRITYTAGLIIVFTGLWGVSIFGNYNTLAGWQQVRQVHVLAYALLFGAASVLSFFLGVRYKDDLARDLGVLFLLINLYTRYFEYFWDAMNKGIFFLILAITFGFVGWLLERKSRSHKRV